MVLVCPAILSAQEFAHEALAVFPADTQQMVYTNLAQLRSSPDYPQLRDHVINQQLRYFQDFLRSVGINPEKDVDEVVLGWRGETSDTAGFFGLANGRFQPDKVQAYYAQSQLTLLSYAGFDLYAFGSGYDPEDLFFAFLDPARAAFGRLPDLKALLEVRQGSANGLDSSPNFSSWEAELESTAPQWGILSGKAATNLAVPWLYSGSSKPHVDLSAFLAPVRAVLYRVEWDGGFTSHLAIVCRDAQSASAMLTFVKLLQSASQQPTTDPGGGVPSIVQSMEASQNGSRVELSASGPVEALDQILRGNTLK
jgi:hypothetical protein